MVPDLRAIYHFLMVAEELSFTRAAARLGIAQPWLSQRIRNLERQLGAELFERTTRKLELTEAGRTLRSVAFPLTGLAREISATARSLKTGRSESLRIGAPPYGSKIDARNQLMKLFAHLTVSIEIYVGWSPYLADRVRDGDLDAAFVVSPVDATALDLVSISSLRRIFVLAPGDPLRRPGPISPRDLAERSVSVFPRGANPALFDTIFGELVREGTELVPTEFDGQVLAERRRSGPLITSYFSDADPDAQRGEHLLEGSADVDFNFVSRQSDRRNIIERLRALARVSIPNAAKV